MQNSFPALHSPRPVIRTGVAGYIGFGPLQYTARFAALTMVI
jgi:hypothetical protein